MGLAVSGLTGVVQVAVCPTRAMAWFELPGDPRHPCGAFTAGVGDVVLSAECLLGAGLSWGAFS